MKAHIEQQQGSNFPASALVVIHQGKVGICTCKHLTAAVTTGNGALSLPRCSQVLKDGTTLADNKVGENGFLVVMVQKVSFTRT